MKNNNILIAMGIASVMVATPALASNTGKVNFVGEIVSSPCSVNPGSLDQTVNLGQIRTKDLENAKESTARPFSIKLENCDASILNITFSGVTLPAEPELLVIGGGQAAGAGVALYHPNGAPVDLGTPSPDLQIVDGNNQLDFAAALKGHKNNATTLKAGTFTATANFKLEYK